METLTCSHVNVFDNYLHWSCVSVKKQYTLQKDKWKCKWFTLTQDLHAEYMPIDTYTHNFYMDIWFFQKKKEHQSCISKLGI